MENNDDAAVFKLTDETAIVKSLDFFPPIVDDPYYFGSIAVTNAFFTIPYRHPNDTSRNTWRRRRIHWLD